MTTILAVQAEHGAIVATDSLVADGQSSLCGPKWVRTPGNGLIASSGAYAAISAIAEDLLICPEQWTYEEESKRTSFLLASLYSANIRRVLSGSMGIKRRDDGIVTEDSSFVIIDPIEAKIWKTDAHMHAMLDPFRIEYLGSGGAFARGALQRSITSGHVITEQVVRSCVLDACALDENSAGPVHVITVTPPASPGPPETTASRACPEDRGS